MRRTDVKRCIIYSISIIMFYPLLISCTILPRSGPTKYDVYKSSYGHIPIIPITLDVVDTANRSPLNSWTKGTREESIDYEEVAVGDRLDITVWENATVGLYTGDQKGAANLGLTTVSGAGMIYLPYVGKVKAAGETLDQLQQKLIAILRNKAINPQVIIKKVDGAKRISVQGLVPKSGTFEVTSGRHDIISAVAEAGGSTLPPELTEVTLERKGDRFKTTLMDIFNSAQNNIPLHPGDNLILSEVSRSFTVIGSTGIQKLIKFPKGEINLIEAIGISEGLRDEIANPTGVFLLRYEQANILNHLIPASRRRVFKQDYQVIYQLDMTKMQSVFAAKRFQLRDGDLIITTDAPYVDIKKILSSISPAVGMGGTIAG